MSKVPGPQAGRALVFVLRPACWRAWRLAKGLGLRISHWQSNLICPLASRDGCRDRFGGMRRWVARVAKGRIAGQHSE